MNSSYALFTQGVRLRPLAHDEAILLGILSEMPSRFLSRTMMVKLAYMLDVLACEQTGQQVSGFTYVWDNHGPNAKSNRIVKILDRLADDGFLAHDQFDNVYGDISHVYSLEGRQFALDLSPDDWILIERTVREWGNSPLKDLVAASKDTRPMRGIKQGDTLTLLPDPDIVEFRDELYARYGDFLEKSVQGARAHKTDPGLTLAEMGAGIGQRTQANRSS